MTGLRHGVIEAGAEAVCGATGGGEVPCIAHRVEARTYLDAILDYLQANADDWEKAYGSEFEEGRVRAIAKGLVAALRDPVTVEPEEI